MNSSELRMYRLHPSESPKHLSNGARPQHLALTKRGTWKLWSVPEVQLHHTAVRMIFSGWFPRQFWYPRGGHVLKTATGAGSVAQNGEKKGRCEWRNPGSRACMARKDDQDLDLSPVRHARHRPPAELGPSFRLSAIDLTCQSQSESAASAGEL